MNEAVEAMGFVGRPRVSRDHRVQSMFKSPYFKIAKYAMRNEAGEKLEDVGSMYILEPTEGAYISDEICLVKTKKCIAYKKTAQNQVSSRQCASHPYYDITTGRKHCERRNVYTHAGLKTKIARIVSHALELARRNKDRIALQDMKKLNAVIKENLKKKPSIIKQAANSLLAASKNKITKSVVDQFLKLPL
jgi:hypothetical protein